jgi:hypothetical protein
MFTPTSTTLQNYTLDLGKAEEKRQAAILAAIQAHGTASQAAMGGPKEQLEQRLRSLNADLFRVIEKAESDFAAELQALGTKHDVQH